MPHRSFHCREGPVCSLTGFYNHVGNAATVHNDFAWCDT